MQAIHRLHAPGLHQLTGCRYPVLRELLRQLECQMPSRRAGRPYAHSLWMQLILALTKLRSATAYRTLAVYFGVAFVTIARYTQRISQWLATLPLWQGATQYWLFVDSTSTRIRSSQQKDYSGYKHHKSHKVQAIVNDTGQVVALSDSYAGSVHDKTIWNKELRCVKSLIKRPVLADKAYIGAIEENVLLLRPIKRNEQQYKENKEASLAFNRELSRRRVKVEHVFAQLKAFKILANVFPLQPHHLATCYRAVAVIYNLNLAAKQEGAPKF